MRRVALTGALVLMLGAWPSHASADMNVADDGNGYVGKTVVITSQSLGIEDFCSQTYFMYDAVVIDNSEGSGGDPSDPALRVVVGVLGGGVGPGDWLQIVSRNECPGDPSRLSLDWLLVERP